MGELERKILTDCDGVLLDWLTGFDRFMSSVGYPAIADEHMYALARRHNIDQLEVYRLAKEFNVSEAIAELQPLNGAVRYVRKLREHGFSFIAITSLSDHPDSYNYRMRNLENLFGDAIEELICLDTGAPKIEVLKRWQNSGLFWIEDHVKNALDGAELGLKSVLVSASHNGNLGPTVESMLYARVGRDEPWKEIYSLIGEHYELPN